MKKGKGAVITAAVVGGLVEVFALNVFASPLIVKIIFAHRFSDVASMSRTSIGKYRKSLSDYDLFSYSVKEYSVASSGETLSMSLYQGENAKGLLLLTHGAASSMEGEEASLTDFFLGKGWAVAALDLTASGRSSGSGIGGLDQGAEDVYHASAALFRDSSLSEELKNRFCLAGFSWGAYSVCASLNYGFDYSPKTVCSFSGFDRPDEVAVKTASRYIGFLAKLNQPFLAGGLLMNRGVDGVLSAIDGLNQSPSSHVVLVQGDADPIVDDSCSIYARRNKVKEQERVSSYLVSGADHVSVWYDRYSQTYLAKQAAKDYQDLQSFRDLDEVYQSGLAQIKENASKRNEELLESVESVMSLSLEQKGQ